MNVAEAVGRTLVAQGVHQAFGVVGSGNFHLTNAMIDAGARFVASRHEAGAATMADAYIRMSGELAAVTVHQGCGLTNAMTGVTEAAKSRTPMVVVAPQATQEKSNFYVDQDMLARSVGAIPIRIEIAATAVTQAIAAVELARNQRRTVILNVPLDVLADEVEVGAGEMSIHRAEPEPSAPSDTDLALLIEALESSDRPVFVAGRGSRSPGSGKAIEDLAETVGALLATSAVAKGLFNDNPWCLDVSGGFSSPLAAELIGDADLIVSWGCALNMWTMRHGKLIGEGTRVIQVDDDPQAIAVQRPSAEGVVGDVKVTAEKARASIGESSPSYRSEGLRQQIASSIRWRDVPYEDNGTNDQIDARTLSIALDDLLPQDRVVSVDSGNFMGYPSMYLSVPDEWGFCFTQAYQSIGLGLATAIGAALAQPDRLPVAALGDGGGLMSIAELETVVRLGIPMVVVVYNDNAYGAEVHHFGPDGYDLDIVEFPPTDIASIARGFGLEALTVRKKEDLDPVTNWVKGDRDKPLLIDAKVTSHPSWWLEEAFGH